MIDYLRIVGLGVVRDAELDLAGGLTVLTGETGAGKTLVLTALDLLLGGKAPTGLAAGESARIEGRWELPESHPARRRALEAGGSDDDGLLTVTRSLPAGGRGRCALGGVGVPAALLAELAPELVTVHGQADQLLLRKPGAQRELLDRFGGGELTAALAAYRQLYEQVSSLDRQLRTAQVREQDIRREAQELRERLDQIAAIDPVPGELAQLREVVERWSRVEELRSGLGAVAVMLSGADGYSAGVGGDDLPDVLTLLSQAERETASLADADPQVGDLNVRLAEIRACTQEFAADVSRYLDRLEVDPERLERTQRRLAEVRSLIRRHGMEIEEVLVWAKSASVRLLELEDAADIAALRSRQSRARLELAEAAVQLNGVRGVVAEALAGAVTAELRQLALPKASFTVLVTPRTPVAGQEPLELARGAAGDRQRVGSVGFGSDGADDIEFRLLPHPGAAPAPISRAASGGELSRVMLALEVVLAADSPVSTYVFDEVDAGIGGRAATEVGSRLARLARDRQVLVVTHLAQVAAFADNHLVVSKSSSGSLASTEVVYVNGQRRLTEIARMLSGQEDSAHALAHARELLDSAAVASAG